MPAMVEEGVSTFKVFLAYKDVLMVTDDQFLRRPRADAARPAGWSWCTPRTATPSTYLVRKALAAGQHRPASTTP